MSTICVAKRRSQSGMGKSRQARAGVHEQEIRIDKVLDMKRQLAEGRYEIADKLDVVVDRLLEDLLGRGRKPGIVR